MPLKPCTVEFPIPSFDADVFDDEGKSAKHGYLVIKKPWPSMTSGILKNHKKLTNYIGQNIMISGIMAMFYTSILTGSGISWGEQMT
jgi:acyl-coenzyme A synthetase/AMP-(fatty) acid ligase